MLIVHTAILIKQKEKKMNAKENEAINKLIKIDDKFAEIEILIKTINFWIKERDYELIPILEMLNSKICAMAEIIRK